MRAKTLKEAAAKLGVSYYRLQKSRERLNQHYHCIPEYMIHGTNGYKWNCEAFRTFI